ncbi:SLBB domain-containing protein [Alishewanella longhuensis]
MTSEEVSSTSKKPEPAKDELKRFGLSMFDPAFSTFAPAGIMPVPDSYILGPDDTLQLNLFGKINQQRQLVINRDGDVFIDELGSVNVAGLTFNQASRLLEQRVKNGLIGVDIAISMGQLRTINIFIAGEAKRPGNYSVPALTSITQALFIAGGVSDIGSLRDIRVNRQGKQVSRFDLYQLLLKGDASNDIHLQNGDVVFVSSLSALAEVHGKVRRPAIFELQPGDTLQTLIDMAGGVTEKGYERAVTLERFDANKTKTLMNIDLTTAQNQKLAAQAGDVLRILQTSNRPQIKFSGSLAQLSAQGFTPGKTTCGSQI